MEKRIVILTRDGLRHSYMRMAFGLADGIEVLRSYCETSSGDILREARQNGDPIDVKHLKRREISEHDFFASFVNRVPDHSNPVKIEGGAINDKECYKEIMELSPDLLVAYGCSLIKDPLLSEYKGNFLNLHLGLSPYYRGTGTNFWPLVNREPEYVGATFMHIDEGVDTGEIIHQLRARVYPGDGPHDIGNRLISDAGRVYPELARQFDELHHVEQLSTPDNENYYRSSDYNPEATRELYENFEQDMIDDYVQERASRTSDVPIIKHPIVNEDELLTEPGI
ncbi:MAG: formyl transferase [bacterium]